MIENDTSRTGDHFYDLIYRDDLTGLYNRRFYKEQIEKDILQYSEGEQIYSLLMFDIDHFKSINDTYTHEEGDHILKTISATVRDFIAEKGTAIRFAGDEFIILMPGIPKDSAKDIALNLKDTIAGYPIALSRGEGSLKATLSIGIANYPVDASDIAELLSIADEAAYISKKKGRNAVSTIDEKKSEAIEPQFLHRYFPCKKFIGRDDLIRELKRQTLPAVGIHKLLTVIEGPIGIGKSRILSEIVQSLDSQRYTIMKNFCQPSTIAQPFWPITDILNRLLGENEELTSSLANQLGQQKIKELVPLIPHFNKYLLQNLTPQELTAEQKRDLLLEALEEILITINKKKPIVIGIDDFQWSNLGTQMLIEKLRNNPKADDIPVFVCINEEDMTSHKDTEFLKYIERMEQKEKLSRYVLEPLTEEEMEKMIISILPELGTQSNIKDIIESKSGGLPLCIEEILKLLIYKGLIHTKEGIFTIEPFHESVIPDNVLETFIPGIRELDKEVYELLCKASVIGDRFSVDMLKKFDGRDEAYVQDLIDKAEKASLISGDPGEETFTFAHNTARNTIYHSIDDEEKKDSHHRLAELEQELNKEEIETALSKIAYHFNQAEEIEKSQQFISQLLNDYDSFLSPRAVDLYIATPPDQKEWLQETELSPQNVLKALRVVKLIQVTMSNIRQFPIDSEIVKGSFESSFWELKKLFENIDVVTYSDGDDEILINGKTPISQIKDKVSEDKFLQILKTAGLKGITLRKNITKTHFLEFLKMVILSSESEIKKRGGWTRVLKEKGIDSIITNERIYVAVAERDIFDPKRLKEDIIASKRAEAGLDDKEAAPAGDRAGTEKLVQTLEEELLNIKEKILSEGNWGEDVGKIRNLLDKIFEKHNILEDFIQKIKTNIEHVVETKKRAESSSEAQAEEQEALSVASGELLNIYRSIDIMTMSKQRFSPDVLVQDLESKDDNESASSAAALAGQGQEAITTLINYLESTESLLGRKRALHLLKKITPNTNSLLLEELMGNTSGEEKKRIIEVLHDFADVDITDCIRYFLRHPSHETRQATINLIASRPVDKSIDFVMEIIRDKKNEDNIETMKDAIHAVGNMKIKKALFELTDLIKRRTIFVHDRYQDLQEAACLALGKIGDPMAVPFLTKALINTPVIFLQRNKSSKVRAAAAYALSYFPSEEVRKILTRASKDPSPDVSSAASMALYNLDKKTPPQKDGLLGPPTEES